MNPKSYKVCEHCGLKCEHTHFILYNWDIKNICNKCYNKIQYATKCECKYCKRYVEPTHVYFKGNRFYITCLLCNIKYELKD
jgi:hypothetical protein